MRPKAGASWLYFIVALLTLAGAFSLDAGADIPPTVNHQGVIKVGTTPFTGTGYFQFAIMENGGGLNVWTNDGSRLGTEQMPTNAVSLSVNNGIYNVRLGDTINYGNMVALTQAALADDSDGFSLRIWFSDGVHAVQELTPPQPLTSVLFAYRAGDAEMLGGKPASQYSTSDDGYFRYLLVENGRLDVSSSGDAISSLSLGYDNAAVIGENDGGDEGVGVRGRASGGEGTGVLGEAAGANGVAVKGSGPDTGMGVLGTGGTGVYGQSTPAGGTAVKGLAFSTAATTNYGGWFKAQGTTGEGVYGEASGVNGAGVHGKVSGVEATGVLGEASGANGTAVKGNGPDTGMGVLGTGGTGVYGQSTPAGGTAVKGLAFSTAATTNYGGWFKAQATTGEAVYGEASGANGTGVHGKAPSTATGMNYGGHFEAAGSGGRGVWAEVTGLNGSALLAEASGQNGVGVDIFTEGSNSRGLTAYNDHSNNGVELAGPDSAGYFEGNVVTTENYRYDSPKTYIRQVSAIEFKSAGSFITTGTPGLYWSSGYLSLSFLDELNDVCLVAPVDLPQGANVTNFRVYYYDNSPRILFVLAYLKRRPLFSASVTDMAYIPVDTTALGTSTAIQVASDNTITGPTVIDNTAYQYYLYTQIDFDATFSSAPLLRFYGASIEYTLDTVAP